MKHLVWYAAFVILLVAGDQLAGLWMHRQALESEFRYSRLYRRVAAADLLLLGNSRGLTFYQPYIEEITGVTTCNLSYNGLPMDAAKCLALDYFDLKNFDPRIYPQRILIDVTICDRENDALLAGFLTYQSRSTNFDTLIRSKLPNVWWGGQVSRLFRYNNEIFQRALYHKNKDDRDWLLDRTIPADLANSVDQHSYDLDVHPYLVQKLAETVEYARHHGWHIDLVIGPYFPGFEVKNLDALKTSIENATGLPVNDYRDALADPADFGDFMHPNRQGSMKYLDLLKKDGILPSVR